MAVGDLHFLYIYMENSPGGKPDWAAIKEHAKETTLKAAQMHYYRIRTKIKKEMAEGTDSGDKSAPTTPAGKGKGKAAASAVKESGKKRKVAEAEVEADADGEDDEESKAFIKDEF